MHRFVVKDGLFWLDEQPILLQAGEFHYFRTSREQWPQRLELLKEAGFNAVATYIPWLWHELEEGFFDFAGNTHPMRDLIGFLDLAAQMGLWIIARPGPYIMAETINEGIPQWFFERYPQAAFIDQRGQAQNIVSYLHPDFTACAERWYRTIFAVLAPRQVERGGAILLVQLDNEMGMMQWVRNILDINPDTLIRFAAHLQKTYGNQLNERYPADDLVDFLREGILHPKQAYAASIVEDYRRFYRSYLHEYASFLLRAAQSNGLEVPAVINIHGFANGGKTFPIGLSQLSEVMQIEGVLSATDVYPLGIGEGNFHQLLLVNEMTKALQNPAQPLFSIEFQAGGNQDFSNTSSSFYDLHTRLSLSVGMRAINHYLFFDGENHPLLSPVKRHDWGHPVRKDGSLRRHFFRYPKLSKALTAYGDALTCAYPQTMTTIGFCLDHFMTEVNNPFSEQFAKILIHQRETILFDFIARGLALTHRPFDALEIGRAHLDPAKTPLLWVMMDRQCEASIQQKLVDYIYAGGQLILIGRLCLENTEHRPCTLLKDALNLDDISSDPPFTDTHIEAFTYPDVPASFVETYRGNFDEVFAQRGMETVGFVKRLGKGRILVFGAALSANTLEDLDIFHQIALKMDCLPVLALSEWADVRLSQGKNGDFLFINNYQDDPIETTIAREGQPLFGGHPICLPARQGAILPLEWTLTDGVLIHYLTAEVNKVLYEPTSILLQISRDEFMAELSLKGWSCPAAQPVSPLAQPGRVYIQGKDGRLTLEKTGR